MGTYINIGNAGFRRARNSEYVDKSGLIAIVNGTLFTEMSFSCVTRCRRFGKSMAAKMLCAYYDQSCDSRELFADLEIAGDTSFEKHLNKYPVIYLDLSDFMSSIGDEAIVSIIQRELRKDLLKTYPGVPVDDDDSLMCYLPNREVAGEMANAVKANNWRPVVKALEASEQLLRDTLDANEEAVAQAIDAAHDNNTSILSYNNENSLACVLSIAYYYAKNDYVMHRELPTGKEFADIVLIPRKNVDSPAILIELKCNKSADTAIDQIHRRQYPQKVAEYAGRLLLVGINYDRETKQHTCRIERFTDKHE